MKVHITLPGYALPICFEGVERATVVHEGIAVPGEDSLGELHVVSNPEGVVLDVWAWEKVHQGPTCNIGTSSETAQEIVERLVKEGE
jgi:hypothetical protein